MDLAVFETGEIDVALRALKGVALANGSVTHSEQQLLEFLAQIHEKTVDVSQLAPIAPGEVATAISGAPPGAKDWPP